MDNQHAENAQPSGDEKSFRSVIIYLHKQDEAQVVEFKKNLNADEVAGIMTYAVEIGALLLEDVDGDILAYNWSYIENVIWISSLA